MKTLRVTLKQHTPLIHFQHDQEGATLRATEVKPKLDRFIIERVFNNSFEECKEYLVGYSKDVNCREKTEKLLRQKFAKGFRALNYKMRITEDASQKPDKYIIASYVSKKDSDRYIGKYKVLRKSPYFADDKLIKNRLEEQAKLGVMLNEKDSVIIDFLIPEKDLKEILEEHINTFFALTNFGCRQNKGFGCFFPRNASEQELIDSFDEENFPVVYYLIAKKDDLDLVFKEIDSIYKTLKSGTQQGESELRLFFNSLTPAIEWEKPAIQKKVNNISRKQISIPPVEGEEFFVRALLGLPELYEYPKHNDIKVRVRSAEKEEKDKIERYASPILFKVFDGCIYITAPKKQSCLISNKTFCFDFFEGKREHRDQTITLKTPDVSKTSFEIIKFLDAAMKKHRKWQRL